MHRFLSTLLTTLLLGAPTFAFAITADQLSTDQKAKLFRPCKTAADPKRCEARQLSRMTIKDAHAPDSAIKTYDAMDLGRTRFRNNEQKARAVENKRYVETNRKTYRQLEITDDLNTQRREFLNELRIRRLGCMTDTKPGRQRRMCIDTLENEMRERMNSPSSADPVLNQ